MLALSRCRLSHCRKPSFENTVQATKSRPGTLLVRALGYCTSNQEPTMKQSYWSEPSDACKHADYSQLGKMATLLCSTESSIHTRWWPGYLCSVYRPRGWAWPYMVVWGGDAAPQQNNLKDRPRTLNNSLDICISGGGKLSIIVSWISHFCSYFSLKGSVRGKYCLKFIIVSVLSTSLSSAQQLDQQPLTHTRHTTHTLHTHHTHYTRYRDRAHM